MKNIGVQVLNTSNTYDPLMRSLGSLSKTLLSQDEDFRNKQILKREQEKADLRYKEGLDIQKNQFDTNQKNIKADSDFRENKFNTNQQNIENALEKERLGKQAEFDLVSFIKNNKYSENDRLPAVQKAIKARRDNIEKGEKNLTQFLNSITPETTEEKSAALIGATLFNNKASIMASSGDTIDQNKNLMKNLVGLEALAKEFRNTNYSKEDKEKRIKEVVNDFYGKSRSDLDNKVSKGIGLSKEQRINSILGNLPQNLKDNLPSMASASALITNTVGGLSEADIVNSENNRLSRILEDSEREVEAKTQHSRLSSADKKASGSGGSNKNSNNYGETADEVRAKLNEKIYGNISKISEENKKEVAQAIELLAKEGYSSSQAEKAIMANVKKGSWLPFTSDVSVNGLESILKSAENIKNKSYGFSKGSDVPTVDELTAKRGNRKSREQIAMEALNLGRYPTQALKVKGEYLDEALSDRRKVLTPTPENVEESTGEEKKVDLSYPETPEKRQTKEQIRLTEKAKNLKSYISGLDEKIDKAILDVDDTSRPVESLNSDKARLQILLNEKRNIYKTMTNLQDKIYRLGELKPDNSKTKEKTGTMLNNKDLFKAPIYKENISETEEIEKQIEKVKNSLSSLNVNYKGGYRTKLNKELLALQKQKIAALNL